MCMFVFGWMVYLFQGKERLEKEGGEVATSCRCVERENKGPWKR